MRTFLTLLFATSFCLIQAQKTKPAFWLGKTTGKLPALSYGLGEDRLGGTKIGYIDSNVLLKVIDSTKDLYAVQLSKYHSAYIEKAYVKRVFRLSEV